jgi:tetratricopeptide (TPR) repeat protein
MVSVRLVAAVGVAAMLCASSAAAMEDWSAQSISLEQRNDWAGLRTLAERWTAAEPENANAWLTLGYAHDGLHQRELAVPAYERWLRLLPSLSVLAGIQLGNLADDYHALGMPAKLRALYQRVKSENPTAAQILQLQYPGDIADSAVAAPIDLQSVVRETSIRAHQWRMDASLVNISVRHGPTGSGASDNVVLTFISRSTQTLAQIVPTEAGMNLLESALSEGSFGIALPPEFLEFPIILSQARRAGMVGDFDSADLAVWTPRDQNPVAAWAVVQADKTHRPLVYVIDARTGLSYRPDQILGPSVPVDELVKLREQKRQREAVRAAAGQGDAAWIKSSARINGLLSSQATAQQNWLQQSAREWQAMHPGAISTPYDKR